MEFQESGSPIFDEEANELMISLPARANIANNNARMNAIDPIQNEEIHISILVAVDPGPINEIGETRKPISRPTKVTMRIKGTKEE